MSMSEKEFNSHKAHCCVYHGCKYGEDNICPVVTQDVEQNYICEDCHDSGINVWKSF